MKRRFILLMASIFLTVLSGCSLQAVNHSSNQEKADRKKKCFKSFEKDVKGVDKIQEYVSFLDKALECHFGPERFSEERGSASKSDILKVKREVELLRAHAIAALITRYGAFNLDGKIGGVVKFPLGENPEEQADAVDIILAVTKVERAIRSETTAFSPDKPPAIDNQLMQFSKLPTVKNDILFYIRLRNIAYFADAIKQSATPSKRRLGSLFGSLMLAVSTKSPTKQLLKDMTSSIGKLYTLNRFGDSYQMDIHDYMTCVYHRELGIQVTSDNSTNVCKSNTLKQDWQYFDKLIDSGCARLKELSELDEVDCTPDV